MGIGVAGGENRAAEAAKAAISSPLLEASVEGATGILLNITGGADLGLFEVNEAAEIIGSGVRCRREHHLRRGDRRGARRPGAGDRHRHRLRPPELERAAGRGVRVGRQQRESRLLRRPEARRHARHRPVHDAAPTRSRSRRSCARSNIARMRLRPLIWAGSSRQSRSRLAARSSRTTASARSNTSSASRSLCCWPVPRSARVAAPSRGSDAAHGSQRPSRRRRRARGARRRPGHGRSCGLSGARVRGRAAALHAPSVNGTRSIRGRRV